MYSEDLETPLGYDANFGFVSVRLQDLLLLSECSVDLGSDVELSKFLYFLVAHSFFDFVYTATENRIIFM